ncbi:MAG: DUF1080 domain-containing protein, partial [Robiginitalea sp.]
MKKSICITALALLALTACKEQSEGNQNKLSMASQTLFDQQEEWIVLFDGTSMDAWRGYGMEEVPETWKIEDGAMVFHQKAKPATESHNLVTRQDF